MQRVGTKQKKRAYYSYTQEAQGKELKRLAAPLHPSSFFEARALQHRVANTEDGPHFRSSKNKKEHIYVLLPFFLQLTSAKKREGHSCLQKPPLNKKKRKQSRYMNSGSCHSRGIQAPNAHK